MRRALGVRVVIAVVGLLPFGCAPDGPDVPVAASTFEPVVLDDVTVVDHRGQDRVDVIALDNVFVDPAIRIDVGSTVVWHNDGHSKHTINPGTGATDVAGLATDDLVVGAEHSTTFDRPGVIEYFCHLHGNSTRGMVGAIIVGDAPTSVATTVEAVSTESASSAASSTPSSSPSVSTTTSSLASMTIRVPSEVQTIQAAVDRAEPGALVLIAPGTYHEAVVVTRDDIHIRGESRNSVVLDGEHELDNGIEVLEADGVTIENLTVMRYMNDGVFWTGVTGYRASYVSAINNGYYGIYAFDSASGVFEHSYASGSPDSGFYIGQCTACDAIVTDVVGENNNFGYAGVNTGDVVIENSTWRHNRAGIVTGSFDHELFAPERTTTIRDNIVEDNGDPLATSPATLDFDAAFGAGIVVVGGLDNVVSRNHVTGSARVGIAVVPNPTLQKNFWPAERNVVMDNVVSGSGQIDLMLVAIPDLGGNCFTDNDFVTSGPLTIENAAPCAGEPTANATDGVPDLARYLDTSSNPPGVPYQQQPLPEPQAEMPQPLTTKPAAVQR